MWISEVCIVRFIQSSIYPPFPTHKKLTDRITEMIIGCAVGIGKDHWACCGTVVYHWCVGVNHWCAVDDHWACCGAEDDHWACCGAEDDSHWLFCTWWMKQVEPSTDDAQEVEGN